MKMVKYVTQSRMNIELSVVGKILKELEAEKNELEHFFRENISFAQYDSQRLQSYFLSNEQSATVKTSQHPSTGPFSKKDLSVPLTI